MHRSNYYVISTRLNNFRKEHATVHKGDGKAYLIEPALKFCEYERIIPAHRDDGRVIVLQPPACGLRVQQMHELLGHFLQTYKVSSCLLQYFYDAFESGLLVVMLEPDVIGQY